LRARAAVADLRARVALDPVGIEPAVVLDRVRAVRRLGPAARRGAPAVTVGALLALTRFHYERNDPALAESICRRALRCSRRAREPRLTLHAYNNLGVCLQRQGRDRRAERAFQASIRLRVVLGDIE